MSRYSSARASSSGTFGALEVTVKTVMEIPGEQVERELRAAAEPVLVHFYTSWCGQCRILTSALEGLAAELADGLLVAKVNLDLCPEIAVGHGIAEVPTLHLFESGTPIARLDVAVSPRQMKAQLQGLLAEYALCT